MNAKEYKDAAARLCCIACRHDGYYDTPAELHHPREGQGMGQRASDYDVIPLCPAHHNGTDHPRTPSIHLDKRKFIARYGTEAELLAEVRALMEKR